MSRIIAGTAGGRKIATPPGDATRPTTDRVREALFSSLESQLGGWDDVAFLDVFAGSGAVGLEALSRGAAHATFIERNRRTGDVIKRNINTVGAVDATVVVGSARQAIEDVSRQFHVVFLDPPYDYADDDLATVLATVVQRESIADDGLLIVERASRSGEPAWPDGVERIRTKKYGETTLWYGRRRRSGMT